MYSIYLYNIFSLQPPLSRLLDHWSSSSWQRSMSSIMYLLYEHQVPLCYNNRIVQFLPSSSSSSVAATINIYIYTFTTNLVINGTTHMQCQCTITILFPIKKNVRRLFNNIIFINDGHNFVIEMSPSIFRIEVPCCCGVVSFNNIDKKFKVYINRL